MKPYSIAIAGSTEHTMSCATSLAESGQFAVSWVLTPTPKLIGRQQILTENPLHQWAKAKQIPQILVEKKIDQGIKDVVTAEIKKSGRPDFLLVVDFGYLIPNWLLEIPAIAPLNVHPSKLPKWRGSSPGQFVLLYGEPTSAVTLMQMDVGLDTGPIIHQEPLIVDPTWNQTQYYQASFALISPKLAALISQFAKTGQKTAQLSILPTPIARRLTKEDGFVPWTELILLCQQKQDTEFQLSNPLLSEVQQQTRQAWPDIIRQACHAFYPWPSVWTIVSTNKGEKRMQILDCRVNKNDKFELTEVKIEGQSKARWADVKNQVK